MRIKRQGRHAAPRKTAAKAGRAAVVLGTVAVFTVTGGLFGQSSHAWAAPMVRALRYVPHTILCERSERGDVAIVTGDGRPFRVVCEPDGPRVFAWDAVR